MPEIGPSDIWFDPRQILPAAKNALLYPVTHPAETAEFGLSMAPGSGEAMSAVDAWNASGRAGNALLSGNYGQAAGEYGNMLLGTLGAIPGAGIIARGTKRGAAWMDRNLPSGVNRLLDAAMPSDPQNTLNAIYSWHGSPHDYPAERLVKRPDGTTEYLVGRPDALPDIPQGHELVQDFPLGRMRMDKIGTGEGAQAYGHGLYSAEHPEVAKAYRDNISAWNNPNSQGKTVDVDALTKELSDMGAGKYSNMLANGAKQAYNDVAYAKGGNPASFDEVIKNVSDVYGHESPIIPRLESLKKEAINAGNFQGRLYHAELDVEPHDLLDWDKPLSQQNEKVRDFAQNVDSPIVRAWKKSGTFDSHTGAELYNTLGHRDQGAMSNQLREAGIPGIKYADQHSRFGDVVDANQTRNYVIFDDKLVKVLKKE